MGGETTISGLKPVARQSTEAMVTEHLRDFILSGEIAPGARLTEIALAEQLGVARSTLRMSLHRLAGEGMVTLVPYTGWHVAALTAEDIWEIWTLRGSLESLASRLAAARPDPEVHHRLETFFTALETACARGSLREMIEADVALHRGIVEAAGHRRLAAQYRVVEAQVRLFVSTSNSFVATGPDDIIAQHAPLIAALRARAPEEAARAAWEHDETEGRRLTAWLAAHPGTGPGTGPGTP
ncbi:GntR family transcriptional regulator [Frigidibacter sp. MR17.24]|uniref:GntR family transcriptional regulator n=1 Tax=Frigidibacter sp. MR17.24 TaxID=3127345 RepID=UPI003012B8EF